MNFPKLMKGKVGNVLILAVKKVNPQYMQGIVVASDSWMIGAYSSNWGFDEFEDFDGSILLNNDVIRKWNGQ